MARWKLTSEAHYLNTVGPSITEWEHKETDQQSGRQGRKVYQVPRYLDPRDPTDFTHKDDGIYVCWPGNGQPRDIEVEGPPTPTMEPIDDEGKDISDSDRATWH